MSRSRIIKQENQPFCFDPGHNPHRMQHILNSKGSIISQPLEMARDEVYIHVCPTCKAEYRIMPDFDYLGHVAVMKIFEIESLDKESDR